jgi:oligopeptide transport system ATP-binding protein
MILQGDVPSPMNVPPGCRFAPRCPVAIARCTDQDPALAPQADGIAAACWRADEVPALMPAAA